MCQQNTKILYNLPALHTCALNGVDGLESGLTATKRNDHALVNIELHPVHSAPVADVSRERCRTLKSSITISLSVVPKQMKITNKSLFDIVHENINEVRSKKKNLRDPREDLKRIRATLRSTSWFLSSRTFLTNEIKRPTSNLDPEYVIQKKFLH